MTLRNGASQLPPSYVDQQHIHTWLVDVFNSPYGLPCICGDQTEGNEFYVVRPYITRICQREDNPCYVEVSFHLGTAQGIYNYNGNLSGFSLDTTDGKDGTWFQLRPEIGAAGHNPSINNTSLAGSTQVDGTWAYANFNPNNPNHMTNDPCVPNYMALSIPVHTFVFDMCDHLSSWFSESNVAFRLTFDKSVFRPSQNLSCGVIFNG